jgi:hypothetical protein
VSALARSFIEAEVNRRAAQDIADADSRVVGLAALIASEHVVLMVASVLPEGDRRMRSLGERAALAAEERLALVRWPVRDSNEAGA